jgi:pimeloyl-[acyl-carrier protein] methyl ester esterase
MLHARHGWGYDAAFWAPLAALLGPIAADDRGYFGSPRADPVDAAAPHLLVGHSLGVMRLADEAGPGCRGIVAINGFDRFAAGPGFPGVASRALDRMARRYGDDPAGTVVAFRDRCGDAAPLPGPPTPRLADDLALLRHGRVRLAPDLPLLRLDGADDPLLSPAHREACLAGASARVSPSGGHLLPLTDPDWCADAISAFLACLW